jgi:ubiquinone/menaquinone biosynthesis C-methylase UbiE
MNTSWDNVHNWYNQLVGLKGHYYHQHVIFPHLLKHLNLKKNISVLDLGCGQGVLARILPKNVKYLGIDLSSNLIKFANSHKQPNQEFIISDISKPLPITDKLFDVITIILAIQDLENPKDVFFNAYKHLKDNGKLFIIINHPCFRIPRQTSWDIDTKQNLQYRRINRYLTPMTIPINTTPGQKKAIEVNHHHHSLSEYSQFLSQTGFSIDLLEEWISDKQSYGKTGKRENKARKEIPLFLCIIASKN